MKSKESLIKKYPIPWGPDKIRSFRKVLLAWYDREGRQLPWRQTKDPYKIWVSEIMLQQTQVSTVIPYYENFLNHLLNIEDLAQASESQLLSLWQGLGYYSRVRNMQTAARQIINDFEGEMPNKLEDLLTLKGIGPYTAGAIASICFNLPEPAMDGNLIRIMTRLFEIGDDVKLTASKDKMMAYLYQLIDPNRPGDFNQALMDIGATIMTPTNYQVDNSPIKDFDSSYLNGTAHLYPFKSKKLKVSQHHFLAYAIQNNQGQWLMRQHTEQELLAKLWHFPIVETQMIFESATDQELLEPLLDYYHLERPDSFQVIKSRQDFSQVSHVFSHRKWLLSMIPIYLDEDSQNWGSEFTWLGPNNFQNYPISTLQKKMFAATGLILE